MKHQEMMNAMVELEKAINKAHKIAEHEFMYSDWSKNNEHDFWYNTMYLLEAMTKIKCTIQIQPKYED